MSRPKGKKKPPLPIKALRESRGMTQQELANELGVTPMSVSRWERGLAHPLLTIERQIQKLIDVFPGAK